MIEISLGQGQQKKAMDKLKEGVDKGLWV